MRQDSKHGLGVGGHSVPCPPKSSQGLHGTQGEKSGARSRRQSEPVMPGGGSQESETREHGSPALSEASVPVSTPSTSLSNSPVMDLATAASPTEDELSHDLFHLMQPMDSGGQELADSFMNASEQPPITSESLAELDMPRIINNPKLRHDVNFDRELHFRPNLDGSKGKQKLKQADEYWKALQGELHLYGMVQGRLQDPQQAKNEAYWQGILAQCQKRLPKIFHAIRDILKTLVPDYDQRNIVDRLDVDLIMQEIQNGVCDLIDLGSWLAKVLKRHCAPMRDSLVDGMQREIQRGAWEGKSEKLVDGLRQLLNILEAMKLDVANHQIRHMRPLLIDDTINFQRRYNAHRISMNKIDVQRSRLWLEYEMAQLTTETSTPTHLEALMSALLRGLLYNDDNEMYPQTFYLDADRLQALRLDMHAGIYHQICRDALIDTAGSHAPKAEVRKAVAALHVTISAIVGTGKFEDRVANIAAEITRIVLMIEGQDVKIDEGLFSFVEQRLIVDLQPASILFEKYAQELTDRLLPKLQTSIQQHVRLSALQLQDKLVAPAAVPLLVPTLAFGAVYSPIPMPHQTDPDEDLIRRFTHTVVLHWQVWADLVYLASEDEEDMPTPSSYRSPSGSPSASPTIPVAQAVYAPGRKWLPIGVKVTEMPSGLPTPAASPAPQAQSPPSSNSAEQGENSTEQSNFDPEQQQPA